MAPLTFLTTSIHSSRSTLLTRSLHSLLPRQQATPEEDRQELAFFEQHKPLVIGIIIAVPVQILLAVWYFRRRRLRLQHLAQTQAELEESRKQIKLMNLEHAMRNNSSSIYTSTSSNASAAGSNASSGSGSSWRGETYRMQDLSMGPPPPVYDGRRGVGVQVGQGVVSTGEGGGGGGNGSSVVDQQVFSGGKI